VFGVPLHYAIPNTLKDCDSAYSYTNDLPPGQYVIPFEIKIHNLLAQQGRAMFPVVQAVIPTGNDSYGEPSTSQLPVTGAGGTSIIWQDGTCSPGTIHMPAAGGTDAVYGFIGPATPKGAIRGRGSGAVVRQRGRPELHGQTPHHAAAPGVVLAGRSRRKQLVRGERPGLSRIGALIPF